jgi:hypothetical protein
MKANKKKKIPNKSRSNYKFQSDKKTIQQLKSLLSKYWTLFALKEKNPFKVQKLNSN